MSATTATTPATPSRATLRRVATASAIGNFVEWFDSAAYAITAATLAAVFFPEHDPTASMLATWAIFGAGFVARPVGAVFFGHYGDRIGRSRMLALSIMVMSGATFAMGLLPTYALIGIAAPLLLLACRLAQGFSTGGEYTGASAFIVEYAPEGRRATFASVIPASVGVSSVAGGAFGALLSSVMSEQTMLSWGWRVPFLVAGALGVVGWYIRTKIADTPTFQALEAGGAVERAPLLDAVKTCWRPILVLAGYSITNAIGYYTMSTYMISYMDDTLGYGSTAALVTSAVSMGAYTLACPLMAMASDRFGRKPMLLVATIGFAVLTVPAFLLMHLNLTGAMLGASLLAVLVSVIGTSNVPALVELFPARVRASGSGIGYTTAYVLFGGTAPMVGTWLVANTGSNLAPGFYLAGIAVFSAMVVLFAFRETKHLPLLRDEVTPAEPPPVTPVPVTPSV